MNAQKHIDTEAVSLRYRNMGVDLGQKRLLLTNFHNTKQEPDLTEPANCNGFGRIRHFRRVTTSGWLGNPLPIDPVRRQLGLAPSDELRVQAFQNAVCNWRCWYCFVPFNLLSANSAHSDWLSASNLIDLYLHQPDPPSMIDLTGGQPDLVPEWVPWMMEELQHRRLDKDVFLWSDDNLSNDYFWRFLSEGERELVATYENYARVCCFKGFDSESFEFNTLADPRLFDTQFDTFARLLETGMNLFAYATITTPSCEGINDGMRRFVDRLQEVHPNLPLRTIPLEIQMFTPVVDRLNEVKKKALKNQWLAVEAWIKELEERYSPAERNLNICDVPLGRTKRL
jgi:uncharacterized Fe-S cluster-containing radical SAM superfamily protein